jgi:cobalt/nickel transport system permease protein
MHISDGFLLPQWCLFWYIISFTVVIYGIIRIKKITEESPELKPLLAVSGAFMFLLSAIRLPSVPGSSSHFTGNGLSAVIFGPAITSVLATIVLLFQALLLAHGGISTLGANVFAMGIAGPFVAWLIYKGVTEFGIKTSIGIFLAAFSADIVTYATTATQLALSFPIPSFEAALFKFMAIFAYTQIPLAVVEGILTVIIWDYIVKLRPDILERLNLIQSKKVMEAK